MSPGARQRKSKRSDAGRNPNSVNSQQRNRHRGKRNNNRNNRNKRRSPRRDNGIRFTKMHGLGNDFIILDLVTQPLEISTELLVKMADRHFGIGCDQVLLVEPPSDPDVDFRYRIFNADGQEVEQCGNGARCFARYVHDKQMTAKERIVVETRGGIIELQLMPDGQVQADMGIPDLLPADIPLSADEEQDIYTLEIDGEQVEVGAVSMGNPHCVLLVDDVDTAPVTELAPKIQASDYFPEGVNVGFVEVVDRGHIKLRVYERGVGETLACGTGACAAMVTGLNRGLLDEQVRVELRGGDLLIDWEGDDTPVMMTGPAVTVFDGNFRHRRPQPPRRDDDDGQEDDVDNDETEATADASTAAESELSHEE